MDFKKKTFKEPPSEWRKGEISLFLFLLHLLPPFPFPLFFFSRRFSVSNKEEGRGKRHPQKGGGGGGRKGLTVLLRTSSSTFPFLGPPLNVMGVEGEREREKEKL